MMAFKCFKCHAFSSTTRSLIMHLRNYHGLGPGSGHFVCGQEKCFRTFNLPYSLKRHIDSVHSGVPVHEELLTPAHPAAAENTGIDQDEELGNTFTLSTIPSF